jgi:DNA-binding IclR family transcriptional regulator
LSNVFTIGKLLTMTSTSTRRGIQSIEVGGTLLTALAHLGRPLALKDLALAAGMAPAKAHPYLVSFGKLGLIEQDAGSGRYGLGPLAMQLGLISLQQLDPVALGDKVIEQLAAEGGHTVALAVWGNRGATIVRIARPASAVHVSMRHGTVMSLHGTASGRLFAALLPRAVVLPVLRAEARLEGRKGRALSPTFAAELQAVRREGLSRAVDLSLPGISAMAAPVFNGNGTLVLALTAIGPSAVFDSRLRSPLAQSLRAAAAALSARLGQRVDTG